MRVDVVLAPNPSLMTGPGTNTWVVASGGEAVVVDPGPVIASHLDAIAAALGDDAAVAVVVTHRHSDHAPAANPLAATLGVPAIGPGEAPRFSPDRIIADGEVVGFGGLEMVAVATPGHTADSTCYRIGDVVFTGDHIMGGSTVIVEDMAAYIASLRRLHRTGITRIHPGHGPVLDDPDGVIGYYIEHRLEREAQILGAVRAGASSVGEVVRTVYTDVDAALHPAAAISVEAHLRKLADEGSVAADGEGSDMRVRPS
jgi:glyoxylase-like metal-dependent hydrolase (beta-lactamase superfamily II)